MRKQTLLKLGDAPKGAARYCPLPYVLVKDESDVEAFLALTGKQAGDKTLKLERAQSKR